ncbi:MAG TPA: 16S rRNA (guanine(527)-N(7))-methyltransferase RsmG [Planctomycetaceae bacterium]|nr:16S rRNA (guanine(527)-N(7))-methyltransferase RsmG [Planctomycetaceae bacterium]
MEPETRPADQPAETLAAALAEQAIELPTRQVARLDDYCRLLWEWNEKINLTRHTDYSKFVARDVVDSLAIAAQLEQGEAILDVGSGGGVPGIVLAIVRPDLKVTLSESVGKKARVLDDLVERLRLRVDVYHGRAEARLARRKFDTIVIRAVARMNKLVTWFEPHWKHIGRIVMVKGPSWVEERGEARHLGLMHELDLRKLAAYNTPGTDAESVVLQLSRKK